MAVALLEPRLWRGGRPRDRNGASEGSAAGFDGARRRGTGLVRKARGDEAADRLVATGGGRLDYRAARLWRGRLVDSGCGGGPASAALQRDFRAPSGRPL